MESIWCAVLSTRAICNRRLLFPSLKTQLARLAQQGVALMACPGCLKAARKTVEDLAPGIRVADKTTFFSFTKGRILTLDY